MYPIRELRRSGREERGYDERRSHQERPSRVEHGRGDRERRREPDDTYSSRNRHREENGNAKEDAPVRRGRGSFRGGHEQESHRREGAGRHGTERGRGDDDPKGEGSRKAKVCH